MKQSLVAQPVDYLFFPTSLGWVTVIDGQSALQGILLGKSRASLEKELLSVRPAARLRESPRLVAARGQILEYLEGRRQAFQLELDFSFLSPFQQEVYGQLMLVPYGATISYGGLAARTGRPRATRAVGRAVAANPFLLAVPCHRVVAADGSLHGFSGGEGISTKRKLLELEGALFG